MKKKKHFPKNRKGKKSNIFINKRRRASKNKTATTFRLSEGLQINKKLVAGFLTVAGLRQKCTFIEGQAKSELLTVLCLSYSFVYFTFQIGF